MYSAEPLPHFVDEYLAYLYEINPTTATFDGVHVHDDLLEDFSRTAIDAQVRTLGGFARRLAAIDPARLTDIERLERPALESSIRARVFELEEVRTWERSPQLFADTLATSLAGQALFDYAPLAERARRVLSKLRQVPRLMQAARDNIKDPPGIFVKVGLESLRGTLRFIHEDLPRAFGDLGDLHLLGDLADASTEASASIATYVEFLETDLAPRSKGSFRLGRERFEQKFSLDEGTHARRRPPAGHRHARVAEDAGGIPARRVARQRRRSAGRVAEDQGGPSAGRQARRGRRGAARRARRLHPPRAHHLAPRGRAGRRCAPTPRFYRWTSASMWTPGPFESRPVRAFYYITDVDPAWPPERQDEHLRDFNYGALWSISIHEVFPGHFLHYQHLRQVESTLRKSILFSSSAFVEGWAHYCEQMMVDEGFRKNDTGVRLGQLAESLIRLCRCIVGIRLHCEDMSVEQAVRFFREEAFLEEPSARREAERGTFDPSYILYSAGKLMLLKLREDYKAHVGAKYSLRGFHDTLLGNGTVPIWLHRALMLGPQNGEALE